MKRLYDFLRQTLDTGITVYTHGELLPAHGYPKLKAKYPHFYGHFGTAWQNQTKDFDLFSGAIVVTTNCLMPPHDTYEDKIFTVGPVGYEGLSYLPHDEQGVFIVGYQKENKSDLFLINSKRDHSFFYF